MFIDHTFVIGAGGSGSQLIPTLARLLHHHPNAAANLTVADGDAFEANNQTRQVCGPQQLGRNKAEAMAELCQALGLDRVQAHPDYVDRPALRRMLLRLQGCPLVISVVDNDATRKAIIDVLGERQGDWVHITSGNADDADGESRISTSTHWHGVLGGEPVGLSPALMFDNIAQPTDAIPARGSCAEMAASAPQLISANALSAAITLLFVQNLLDERLDPSSNSAFANGRTFRLSFS